MKLVKHLVAKEVNMGIISEKHSKILYPEYSVTPIVQALPKIHKISPPPPITLTSYHLRDWTIKWNSGNGLMSGLNPLSLVLQGTSRIARKFLGFSTVFCWEARILWLIWCYHAVLTFFSWFGRYCLCTPHLQIKPVHRIVVQLDYKCH